ncbi:MAG TPA: molybdenum ABC transporter ATP-binding protein [Methylocella sp.]|nr:molybdenum ABC transporter ATP-binding protein [Methylocella sp.]
MIEVDVGLNVGTFDLKVAFGNGEGVIALFGQSGSGKSLTLSLIAGLLRPNRGRIVLDAKTLVDTERGVFVPMHRRRIGLVFQDSNLFPHFSVKQNLLFGSWFAPYRTEGIDFGAVIETLGIEKLLARRAAHLSGGERQRVAIGRALLSSPKLLLFDEPLAALDLQRKLEILSLIEHIRDEFKVPIVYVSHAIDEVIRLAATIVMLDAGRVKAIGGPSEVFGKVGSQTAEERFDRISVLTTKVVGENAAYGLTELKHSSGTIWLAGRRAPPIGSAARIIVRATDVTLSLLPPRGISTRSVLCGAIENIESDGPLATVAIALDGEGRLFAAATRYALDEMGLNCGVRVFALIKTSALDERKIASIPEGLGR